MGPQILVSRSPYRPHEGRTVKGSTTCRKATLLRGVMTLGHAEESAESLCVMHAQTSRRGLAGIVNPPGPKSRPWVGADAELPADPDAWRQQAVEHQGTWWEDWATWIGERAGERRPPPRIGSDLHRPQRDAPGSNRDPARMRRMIGRANAMLRPMTAIEVATR